MLEAAGVLGAMPEGPPAPMEPDLGFFDPPGPTWEWPEPGPGAPLLSYFAPQNPLNITQARESTCEWPGAGPWCADALLHCTAEPQSHPNPQD